MKTKNIILILGVILIIGFLFLWGKTPSSSETNPTDIGITLANFTNTIPLYEFGQISMSKGKVARDFTITNNSGRDLLITQTLSSCMCTSATLTFSNNEKVGPFGMPGHGTVPTINKVITRGDKFTVRAIFDPAAHGPAGVGYISRQITLKTDQGEKIIQFSATVTP